MALLSPFLDEKTEVQIRKNVPSTVHHPSYGQLPLSVCTPSLSHIWLCTLSAVHIWPYIYTLSCSHVASGHWLPMW